MARPSADAALGVAEKMRGARPDETVGAWFDVGERAYREGARGPENLPPLNDVEAQRWWLGGFGAAWAEGFDVDESADEALVRLLAGRAALLRQLRSHRLDWGSRREQ